MNKLSADRIKEKDALVARLTSAHQILEDAISAFNGTMAAARAEVETKAEKLNEIIGEANTFREAVNGEQEDYYADKSEKWQEGDAGQNYESWKSEWESEIELVELEFPDDLESPSADAAATLEDLPDSPD